MEIKGRKVVGSERGWLDAETGELVVSLRGLSETTFGKVGKKSKPEKVVAPEVETVKVPEPEVEKAPEPVAEKPAKAEKLPTPKKTTKKAK